MGSIRRVPLLSILLSLLAVASVTVPSQAQRWTGSAGVGVEVTGPDGRPVEGAEIVLSPAEGEADVGPEVVVTDARGRAAVRGLAAGEWVLTVRHPETMAYVARLRVREGRKPKEISASQIKVGDSLRSLRLSYFEESGPAPPSARSRRPVVRPPAPQPTPPPAREPAPRPAPEPVPAPEAPAATPPSAVPEPDQPAADAAPPSTQPPPPSEPAPEPEPMPEPMPEVKAEPEAPPTLPEPAVAPEREPVPPPAPAPDAEAAPAPAPVPPLPEPTPVQAPRPEPAPMPRAGAEPPRRAVLTSFQEGTCVECQPGEWAVAASAIVAPGDGVCPGDLKERVDRAAGLLGSSRALGPWAGQVDSGEGGASSVLGDVAYREYRTVLEPVMGRGASCQAVAVMLPAGATFVGFQYEVGEGGQWASCLPAAECPAGGGRWSSNPMLARTPAGVVVAGAYENRGPWERQIRLTVYFTAPEGWRPR